MTVNTILYISALASEAKINLEYKRTNLNPGFAVQKFSRLLVKGLVENGAKVLAFSNPPNLASKKMYISSSEEIENQIHYKYIPYLNIPILKHICLFFYTFFYVLLWGSKARRQKAVICDVLSISTCMGALLATKINRVMSVAVVTDIYGMMVNNGTRSFLAKLAGKLNAWYGCSFNRYILLTNQMNEVINPKGAPYIVMEALCDSSLQYKPCRKICKNNPRTVIYAGGIYEKYGLKLLAEAFIKANVENAKLVYYGSGSFVEDFKKLCAEHSNLEYRGVAPNDIVFAEEQKASLLVNPRFTTEEFAKYSFPSKNMEYMASGTPLLTTNLPGMPQEYHDYVFLFREETVEAYSEAIRNVLSHSETELISLGNKARDFVLFKKNNLVQGKKILIFLNN